MLPSVSQNSSVVPVFWVSDTYRCTSWGLIPVSPEAPLVLHLSRLGTEGLGRRRWPCLSLATWYGCSSHCKVPWVTWPAVTRPPQVMWHSPTCEGMGVGRARCWWESCPSLEGVNEAKGVSWILFLVVFLRAGPLQGGHRLLHTVVQDVLHLRKMKRRSFSQLHLFHNNNWN